jgi:putative oxidoreductase
MTDLKTKQSTTVTIISVLLILLWSYVAVSKMIAFGEFRKQISAQPLPHWVADTLAWILPMLELVTAFLLTTRLRLIGLFVSSTLLLGFTLYVGLILSHGLGKIPCSCGGIFKGMKWKGHLVFNAIATLAAFSAFYVLRKQVQKLDHRIWLV